MFKSQPIASLSGALALAIALVAFGPAAAAQPFEIPVMISQTGAAAFLGKEQRESYAILEKVVNASGGVRGRPLHFAYYDDQSSPQVGLQIVHDLIAKNATAIIGSSFAQVCAAVAPIVNKSGPVLYCLSPGIHPSARWPPARTRP